MKEIRRQIRSCLPVVRLPFFLWHFCSKTSQYVFTPLFSYRYFRWHVKPTVSAWFYFLTYIEYAEFLSNIWISPLGYIFCCSLPLTSSNTFQRIRFFKVAAWLKSNKHCSIRVMTLIKFVKILRLSYLLLRLSKVRLIVPHTQLKRCNLFYKSQFLLPNW
jgi:hypothetical protein